MRKYKSISPNLKSIYSQDTSHELHIYLYIEDASHRGRECVLVLQALLVVRLLFSTKGFADERVAQR